MSINFQNYYETQKHALLIHAHQAANAFNGVQLGARKCCRSGKEEHDLCPAWAWSLMYYSVRGSGYSNLDSKPQSLFAKTLYTWLIGKWLRFSGQTFAGSKKCVLCIPKTCASNEMATIIGLSGWINGKAQYSERLWKHPGILMPP